MVAGAASETANRILLEFDGHAWSSPAPHAAPVDLGRLLGAPAPDPLAKLQLATERAEEALRGVSSSLGLASRILAQAEAGSDEVASPTVSTVPTFLLALPSSLAPRKPRVR